MEAAPELDGKILGISRRIYPPHETLTPLILAAIKSGEVADVHKLSGQTTVTVVLIGGGIGDYAAYIGIGSPEWVRRFGHKLRFEEAAIHFPSIERERYRQ